MLYVLRAGLTQAIEWPVLALVFVALFLPLSDPLRRARSVFVWMFLWHIVLLMFTTTDFGRLVLWVPVACLFAAAALDHLLRLAFTAPRRLWRWTLTPTTLQRLTALAVVGLLILMGLLPQVMGGDQTNPSAANERYLAQITEPDDVIATDDPWRVAWELNRPTLWLPQTAEDLEAIEEATEDDIRVIYFTVRTPNPFSTESGDWWTDARSNQLGYREWLPADSRVQGERILIRPEADATAQPGDEATDAPSGMSDEPAP